MIRHLPATARTTFFVGAHPVRDALAVGMKLQAKASRASALLPGVAGLREASRA